MKVCWNQEWNTAYMPGVFTELKMQKHLIWKHLEHFIILSYVQLCMTEFMQKKKKEKNTAE